MPDVDPETPCEYCTTSPAKLRSGFCSLGSFSSHRSTCKKKLLELQLLERTKKKQKIQPATQPATQPAAAAAKQSKAAAAAAAKRNRSTGTGDPSLPLELGSTVDVFFGMRPDGTVPKSSAVIVDVARVEHYDQSKKYAALLKEDGNDATTSKAATCQYAYRVDYKDEALPLGLPGSGKIIPLCEPV